MKLALSAIILIAAFLLLWRAHRREPVRIADPAVPTSTTWCIDREFGNTKHPVGTLMIVGNKIYECVESDTVTWTEATR